MTAAASPASFPGPLAPARTRLRRALSEGRAVVAVDRVFAHVEAACGLDPAEDPLVVLSPLFRAWRRALAGGDLDGAREAATMATGALDASWEMLAARDRALRTNQFRHVATREPLGTRALTALARFYARLPPTPASQSRYEWSLTRLFAGPLRPGRTLVAPAETLVARLADLLEAWGFAQDTEREAEVALLVEALVRLTMEAAEAEDLAAVGRVFQGASVLKAALGPVLYDPRASVAVMECNVVLGDAFCERVSIATEAAVSREMTDLLEECWPAAAVSLPEQIDAARLAGDAAAVERLSRIATLLEVGTAPAESAGADARLVPPGPPEPSGDPGWPPPEADALRGEPSNAAVLDALFARPRSREMRALDLRTFLGPLRESAPDAIAGEAALRRRAFAAIVAADDLVAAEGAAGGGRADAVVRELVAAGTELRAAVARAQAVSREAAAVLLDVSNRVLWARLRLESARARPRTPPRVAAPTRIARAVERVRENAPAIKKAGWKLVKVAAVLGAVAAVGFGLLGATSEVPPSDPEVQVVDVSALPGRQHVVQARRRPTILVVTAAPSWSRLAPEARREHLKALAAWAGPQGITTVMLVDAEGQPAGSVADGLAALPGDPPPRE